MLAAVAVMEMAMICEDKLKGKQKLKDRHLPDVHVHPGELGDKERRNGLVERSAVHVDGRSYREDKAGDPTVHLRRRRNRTMRRRRKMRRRKMRRKMRRNVRRSSWPPCSSPRVS
jgi:hypothetical protein